MIVLGLSSGTSVDGIDVAAADLHVDGAEVVLRPLGHRAVAYGDALRAAIMAALPPASTTVGAVCALDTRIGQEFAAAAAHVIDDVCGGRVDLIASHGQTVHHWVDGGVARGSLQLGQPAWIAEATGVPVVSDVRMRDIAAGGHGAPLASTLDVLLLADRAVPVAALNIGGIANLTVVRPSAAPVAFDTGPGNALLDAAVGLLSDGAERRDDGGRRAARGTVDAALLDELLDDSYYDLEPPKSTGREVFHRGYVQRILDRGGIADDDLLATLTALTARTVADACVRFDVREVIASGGGTHNRALMAALRDELGPASLHTTRDLGLPVDAKEAYLFALLGFLTWSGVPATVPSCTGARHATLAGHITPGATALRLPPPTATPHRLRIEATTG